MKGNTTTTSIRDRASIFGIRLILSTQVLLFQYYMLLGTWQNNKIDGKGKMLWKNKQQVYEGDFKQGKRCGQGVFKYGPEHKTLEMYEGTFLDDKKNGYGTILYKNGISKKGNWKNDQLI